MKEYFDNGILEFDGEYLKGEENGKAKRYYYDGELMFEGEYRNGIKWNGKEFKSLDGDKLDIQYVYIEGNRIILK